MLVMSAFSCLSKRKPKSKFSANISIMSPVTSVLVLLGVTLAVSGPDAAASPELEELDACFCS